MRTIKWYQYMMRFFFTPCCTQCTNIAHRAERYGGRWENRCLNHLIDRSSISIPLDNRPYDGWNYDPGYNSIFQRVWVKLKWKQIGKAVRSNKR